jgi:hypothetical protein
LRPERPRSDRSVALRGFLVEGLSELGGLLEVEESRPACRSSWATRSPTTATCDRSSTISAPVAATCDRSWAICASLAASSAWCSSAWVVITVRSSVLIAR